MSNPPTDRRKTVRDLEKGHHMAPRQRVTSKRKEGTVKTPARERVKKAR